MKITFRLLPYLICLFILPMNSCASASSTYPVYSSTLPEILQGQVLPLTNRYTLTSLNELFKANPLKGYELWRTQDGVRYIATWAFDNARAFVPVNAKETAPEYWKTVTGVLVNRKDWSAIFDTMKNLGYEKVTDFRDVTLTPLAKQVSTYAPTVVKGIGSTEALFSGTVLYFDFTEFIEQFLPVNSGDL